MESRAGTTPSRRAAARSRPQASRAIDSLCLNLDGNTDLRRPASGRVSITPWPRDSSLPSRPSSSTESRQPPNVTSGECSTSGSTATTGTAATATAATSHPRSTRRPTPTTPEPHNGALHDPRGIPPETSRHRDPHLTHRPEPQRTRSPPAQNQDHQERTRPDATPRSATCPPTLLQRSNDRKPNREPRRRARNCEPDHHD